MIYTDKLLKQLLAKMLPELVEIRTPFPDEVHLWWIKDGCWVRDSELLHLCWLLESVLTTGEAIRFVTELSSLLSKQLNTKTTWEIACTIDEQAVQCAIANYVRASWQQRTTALAKVKGLL